MLHRRGLADVFEHDLHALCRSSNLSVSNLTTQFHFGNGKSHAWPDHTGSDDDFEQQQKYRDKQVPA